MTFRYAKHRPFLALSLPPSLLGLVGYRIILRIEFGLSLRGLTFTLVFSPYMQSYQHYDTQSHQHDHPYKHTHSLSLTFRHQHLCQHRSAQITKDVIGRTLQLRVTRLCCLNSSHLATQLIAHARLRNGNGPQVVSEGHHHRSSARVPSLSPKDVNIIALS